MQKQCAGCGTIFDDGSGIPNPAGVGTIHGCCPECNGHTFAPNPAPAAEPPAEQPVSAEVLDKSKLQ